jgi:hypothetical protein
MQEPEPIVNQNTTTTDITKMNVKELKEEIKARGLRVKNVHKMKKQDLLDLLR